MPQLDVARPDDQSALERCHVHAGADGAPVLRGARCADCDLVFFPPTQVCPRCASIELEGEDLPRSGTLYSETTVHIAPPPWSTPYRVGYVDLANGARIFTHLKGEAAIGDTLTLTSGVAGKQVDGTPIEMFMFEKKGA